MRRDARVFDIDWDIDGQTVALPKEVGVWIEHEDAASFDDEEEITSLIGNILSEEYGWCVNDFRWGWVSGPSAGSGGCARSSGGEDGEP